MYFYFLQKYISSYTWLELGVNKTKLFNFEIFIQKSFYKSFEVFFIASSSNYSKYLLVKKYVNTIGMNLDFITFGEFHRDSRQLFCAIS